MPLARARCPACSEPLGDPPHVPVPCRCGSCGTEAPVPFGADGQPAAFETMLTAPELLRWFGAARHAMVTGRLGIALGACAKCKAPLVVSSRQQMRLPCPHCQTPACGEAATILVDQWPEPWCKVEGGGLSLEYRLASVDDSTGVTAGCAACALATPANEPGTRCRRCNAVTWAERDGRRVQLGVRASGTRTDHPFNALVPICQGEQMLMRDAAVGASAESGKSIMGITGVGCAIGTALVIVPIVIGIAYAMAKC